MLLQILQEAEPAPRAIAWRSSASAHMQINAVLRFIEGVYERADDDAQADQWKLAAVRLAWCLKLVEIDLREMREEGLIP